MTRLPGLSDEDVKNRLATMLRMYVGQGRYIRFEDLAAFTADDKDRCLKTEARCLRSYVEAEPSMISLGKALRALAVLPPEALNMMLAPLGYCVKPLETDNACINQAVSGAARFVAAGAEALADGTIDHQERFKLATKAAELVPVLQAIAAAGRKA